MKGIYGNSIDYVAISSSYIVTLEKMLGHFDYSKVNGTDPYESRGVHGCDVFLIDEQSYHTNWDRDPRLKGLCDYVFVGGSVLSLSVSQPISVKTIEQRNLEFANGVDLFEVRMR